MIITKIIIIFLLILTIIILINKKHISEHLTSSEAIDNYLNYIDNRIKSQILSNKIMDEKIGESINTKLNDSQQINNIITDSLKPIGEQVNIMNKNMSEQVTSSYDVLRKQFTSILENLDKNLYIEMNEKIKDEMINNKICDNNNNCLNFKKSLLLNNRLNQYMYLPEQNIIWDNLRDKINNGWGATDGETINRDFDATRWNGKYIYRLTNHLNQSKNKGIKITVPPYTGDRSGIDYSVLWIQVNGNMWMPFMVSDGTTIFGKFAAGYNKVNKIGPSGSIHNDISTGWIGYNSSETELFEWYPVPIKLNASRELIVSNPFPNTILGDTWYSGFAFSTNPWNHCKISARTVYLNMNKDDATIDAPQNEIYWNSISFKNIPLAQFNINTTSSFRIPFVNSGSNKIFYIVDFNDSYVGQYLQNISINNTNIGSLYTTFDNPFSRHFNSRMHHRYNGVVIPKEILPANDNFITVKITIPNNSNPFYFTECGTHDENPFD